MRPARDGSPLEARVAELPYLREQLGREPGWATYRPARSRRPLARLSVVVCKRLHPVGGSTAYQVPLELGDGRQDCPREPTDRAGGVDRLVRTYHPDPACLGVVEEIEQLARRAAETVEFGGEDHIDRSGADELAQPAVTGTIRGPP